MKSYSGFIINPRKTSESEISKANDLYLAWENVFSKVVEKAGGKLDPDDYFRNDFAIVLCEDAKIMAFTMCTVFDLRLRSSTDHHYWKALQPDTIQKFRRDGYNRIMSMEYLTVFPEFRKNSSEVIWAEILVAIGLLYQDKSDAIDAMIGTPRMDLTVNATSMNMGGISVQEPILKMNYPCDVHIFPRQKNRKFANPTTALWTQKIWNELQDYTDNQTNTKQAA